MPRLIESYLVPRSGRTSVLHCSSNSHRVSEGPAGSAASQLSSIREARNQLASFVS